MIRPAPRNTRAVRRLAAPLLCAWLLVSCSGDSPLGPPVAIEGRFVGLYQDVSTCITPAAGTWPMTIWLYDHNPNTGEISLALRWDHSGSISNADEHFRGTIDANGDIRAFAYWSGELHADYEIEAAVTGENLLGRYYEHCGDGTADIWEFALARED
jgi:hypothetical protein